MEREQTISKEETVGMCVGSSDDMATLFKVYQSVKKMVPDASFIDRVTNYGDCGLVVYDAPRETDYYLRFKMGDGVGTVAVPLEFVTPIMVDKKSTGKVVVRVQDPNDRKRKKDDELDLLDGQIEKSRSNDESMVFRLTRKGSIPKQVRSVLFSTFKVRGEGQRLCDAGWPPEHKDD